MKRTLQVRISYPLALLTGFIVSFVLLCFVLIISSFVRVDKESNSQETNVQEEADTLVFGELGPDRGTTRNTKNWTFRELSQIQNLYERQIVLREQVHAASEDQVNELLEESESIDDNYGNVLLKCELFTRLTIIDPYQATAKACKYSWNIRSSYIATVFAEWSSTDIDDAISHAKTLSNFDQGVAVGAILRSASNLTTSQIMEIARNFNKESLGVDVLQSRALAHSIHNPESAWFALLNDHRDDYVQSESLSKIAKTWIDQEGMEF